MKTKLTVFLAIFLVAGVISCKRDLYGVLTIPFGKGISGNLDRVPGIACANTDTLYTFEDGFVSFSEEHMLCVDIQMDDEDFEEMRYASRFGPSILEDEGEAVLAIFMELLIECDVPWPDEYKWYPATLSIDGIEMTEVGIRKKGFLGSIFSVAPSFKIKPDRYVANRKFGKSQNITFNNNREDPSRMRMLYNLKLFEKLDYPAPRANLSNVSINGEHLGAYTHLEAIDDDFLERQFGSKGGHLYEGQLADFVEPRLTRWDRKTDNDDGNLAQIRNINRVLATSVDSNLVAQLDFYLNMDRFIDFWAMEILLDHVDGYTSNRNNFLLYFDPNDGGRGSFIPWGLNYTNQVEAELTEVKPFVSAALPRRLSRIPEVRQQLSDRMQMILDEVYNEDEIIAWLENYKEQVQSSQVDPNFDAYYEELIEWVTTRRGKIENWLILGISMGEEGIQTGCL